MNMLKLMYSKTRKDIIINERNWEHLDVGSINVKLKEIHIRWFEHVQHSQ